MRSVLYCCDWLYCRLRIYNICGYCHFETDQKYSLDLAFKIHTAYTENINIHIGYVFLNGTKRRQTSNSRNKKKCILYFHELCVKSLYYVLEQVWIKSLY